MEMEIKYYPEEPFKEVLDEMGVITSFDREEFFKVISMYGEELDRIATEQKLEEMQELEGFFNWRSIEPEKYFKIYFSYYNSKDLLIAVNGFDELSREQYLEEYGSDSINDDCGCDKETEQIEE
jgi:hypothetical protein